MNTKLLNSVAAATTLAGMMVTAGVANATSLTRTVSTEFALTDIVNKPLTIQQFDSSLGTLNSVILNFTSHLTGEAGFENRGATASTVIVRLGAQVNLTRDPLELSPPFPINPFSDEESYTVAAYDGTTDFGGTSGMIVEGLKAEGSATKTFTGDDLNVFIGTGNLDFLFTALAQSTVTGGGNMRSYVDTLAKANLSLTYNYDPLTTVPEPSALLGIGLFAGIGVLSQRKKSWFKISHS